MIETADSQVLVMTKTWIVDRRHRSNNRKGMNMRMTKILLCALALMVAAQTVMTSNAQAQFLKGDARLACEVILCLGATGSTPGECGKALAKYEALKAELWFNPLAVYNFLKGCPKK